MNLPLGFQFAGTYAGIKKNASKRDMALIVSDRDATAVGMFTTNRVCAAPVQVCRGRVPSATARGVIVNSGNANACTGEQGVRDAEEMTSLAAAKLGIAPKQLLVCSTGVIGRPLPMEKIRAGIDQLTPTLGSTSASFEAAALGILTTDTRIKTAHRQIEVSGTSVTVAGFAKGAAMIGPNMATMLAFVLTDAVAAPTQLRPILKDAVDASFHSISVEGHTSTNDTVLLFANGASGQTPPADALAEAIQDVAIDLAVQIVDDAEECTHRLTIDVVGTRTLAEARTIAKAVADSPLVKTAVFGNDPNWGRICSAAGYCGVPFEEKDLSLRVNGTLLYDCGAPTPFDGAAESARMKESKEVHIELIFTLGEERCRFWSSDLSTGYVRFNAEYTT